MNKIVNGKNGIVCAFCGKEKTEVTFTIGASTKPDWCMVYGTGKMTCPDCYDEAQRQADDLADKMIMEHNRLAQLEIKKEQKHEKE